MALSAAARRRRRRPAASWWMPASSTPSDLGWAADPRRTAGLEPRRVDAGLVEQPAPLEDAFGRCCSSPARTAAPDPRRVARARAAGVMVTAAVDPLAQVLLAAGGRSGGDRRGQHPAFGVPMGFGGPMPPSSPPPTPTARIPGRLVGQSPDAEGCPPCVWPCRPEQHIRRDKATSQHLHARRCCWR
jgi:glycine dehydrogenase